MAKKHKNIESIKIQWDGDLTDPPYGDGNKNQRTPTRTDLGTWLGWSEGGYVPDYDCPMKQDFQGAAQCYFEDYDLDGDGEITVADKNAWEARGGPSKLVGAGVSSYLDGMLGATMYWHAPPHASGKTVVGMENSFGLSFIDWFSSTTAQSSGVPQHNRYDPNIYSEAVIRFGESWYGKNRPYQWTWGDVVFIQEIVDGIGTGSRRARETRLNQFEEEKKKKLIRLICRVKGEKVYDEEKEMGDTYIKREDAELVINEVLGKIRVENANVL